MGACLTVDADEKKAKAQSEKVDKFLQECAERDTGVVKILLLGPGESGKSTIVKQMKIIHNEGFSTHELQCFKPAVLENLIGSMKYVLYGMGVLRINLERPQNKVYAEMIMTCRKCYDSNVIMLPQIRHALEQLWHDRGIHLAVSRGYEYELNDSASYYFENMTRISSARFFPNPTDVLRARVRTTGIIETCFRIDGMMFRLFDVGGQKSERKRWIQYFDDVQAILYVAALSSYDMYLCEDITMNRLEESLKLFESICNNPYFFSTSMLLFLNKVDLFRDKIMNSKRHLRFYFPKYAGPDRHVECAAAFMQSLFLSLNRSKEKIVYPHFTTATDTSNVQVVFDVIIDSILKENLKTYEAL